MKTVATFSKPEEAHLMRMRLGAAGIAAYVIDEHIVQMDWLYSNAVGGVRVQIAEDDIEAAREFFASDKPPAVEVAEAEPAALCPRCGSEQTVPDELPRRLAFLSMLLFGFPFFYARHRWRCHTCNHSWKPSNSAKV